MAGLVTGMTIIGTMIARFSAGILTTKFSARQLTIISMAILVPVLLAYQLQGGLIYALMLDLRTDFSLPCKLIAEEHFLYDSIFTRI